MNEYFATLPAEDLIKELQGRIDGYYNWLLASYRLARWRMAFDTYYGQRDQHNSSHITVGGEQGELSLLMSNEYRNLVQHLLVLTTQNRPNIELVGINTDTKTTQQCIIARGILDYYRREGGIDDSFKRALEVALIMDHAWVFTEWNVMKGPELRPDMSGNIVSEGDIEAQVKTPLDVVVDYTKDDGRDFDWQIKRELINKYDLAAQYPEKAEEILSVQRDKSKDSIYRFGDQQLYNYTTNDSPLVERWTFYHKKSPSVKQGRMVQFLNGKTWLFDGPLPYRRLPGRRCCPTEMIMSALGYSNANDLLGLQDSLDAMVSAAITNMTSAGVNNIWVKPNSNIDFEQLTDGMNYIESEEKPEVLILNKLSPQWFDLSNWIISRMEAYSGVNSVARGNTEGKDMSGAAMALLQDMSIRFNSGMQKSYNQMIEEVCNDCLSHLQDFAKSPRIAIIAGENNKYALESFTSKDMDGVQRVYVRQSNPMEATTAGKLKMAEDIMQIPNAITRPSQYLQVLRTGQIEPLLENEEKEAVSIKGENEALARGEIVPVAFTENHPKHMAEHASVLWDAKSKQDPNLIQNVQNHFFEHLTVWQQTDPAILQSLGIPPYPFPQPPMIPGQPGQPMQPAQEQVSPNTEPSEPGQPGQPNFPTNPLTGEQYQPTQGA